MSGPRRVQLKRTKGWRMPANTVKVDRTTKWGNPYRISEAREHGYTGTDREIAHWCVRLFEAAIHYRGDGYVLVPDAATIQAELAGKNLACWCPPDQPCHADVLLELANAKGEQ